MKLFGKDLSADVVVVAEVGNNHEGDVAVARRLIREAKRAGADAVKFQTFRADAFVSAGDPARRERLRRFELTPDDFRALASAAREEGIPFFSTPLDLESARFVCGLCEVVKVASCDIDYWPMLEIIAGAGKPVILSTGMATAGEIARAVEFFRARMPAESLALLHCVSSYPLAEENANLAAIPALRARFGGVVGYSDHTAGLLAPLAAVALGARIIEKHFTLSKTHSDFRDHQLSLEPAEMARLADEVRRAAGMLGHGELGVEPCERETRAAAKRGWYAARDLRAGETLDASMVAWMRPPVPGQPADLSDWIGRPLGAAVAAGRALAADDFVSA